MDEQALDTLCYDFDQVVTVSDDNFKSSTSICDTDETLESSDRTSEKVEGNSELMDEGNVFVNAFVEKVEENSELMDEGNVFNDEQTNSSPQDQTLPIFEKILDLSNKVQKLRQDQETVREEVKGITLDSIPGFEVVSALQNLSEEHETFKKKTLEECELMKKKYLEVYAERKKLYNEVIELKGNIRVFCRCRPLNADEITNGFTSVADFSTSQDNELQIICPDSSKKQFKFDHVFRPDDNQEAVFVETMPIVTSVLDGFNVCIFAYGQTGTGKTFTMEGTAEHRGVNYRTLEELFRMSNERSSTMKYELFVSMLEVYNERIRDLLIENPNQNAKKLEIKQSAEGTQEVPGLVESHVYNTNEVWELLKSGSRARSVGSTNANELSSRSHCLVRVTVMGDNLLNGQKTRSHLWLVDLAGSERVGRIEVEGERLKESQFINKSLSALGDVISALANNKSTHIPYRNSKLTHILQSSLGGDCKTLMFVQISPSSADFGETICSLNFATRVRGVEHGPARKQTDVSELLKYKQLAEKAKHDEKETKKLQDTVNSLQLRLSAREHVCRTFQDKVKDLENQLAEERKTRMKQENRALAAVSVQTSQKTTMTTTTERRPPLAPPSKMRMPLRRITNYMPTPPPPSPLYKPRNSLITGRLSNDKENVSRTVMDSNKTNTLLRARRGSIAAVRSTNATTSQVVQPKRRASIATFRPEPVKSPVNSSYVRRQKNDRVMGRQSFVWDPQRVWRTSRVSSPLAKVPETPVSRRNEATPGSRRSSKFMGSPPTSQVGSWKPKHPAVVAVQKKHFVWSPLNKALRINRKSFMSPRRGNNL